MVVKTRRKRKTRKRHKGGMPNPLAAYKERVDRQEEKKRRPLFGQMKIAKRRGDKEEQAKISKELKKSFDRQTWYGTQGAEKNLDVLTGMQVQKAMPEIEKSIKRGLLVPRKPRTKSAGGKKHRKKRTRKKKKSRKRRRIGNCKKKLKRLRTQYRRFRIAKGDKRFKGTDGLIKWSRPSKSKKKKGKKRSRRIYHRKRKKNKKKKKILYIFE